MAPLPGTVSTEGNMKKESRGRDLKKRGAARKPGKVSGPGPAGPQGLASPAPGPWLERARSARRPHPQGLLPVATGQCAADRPLPLRPRRLGQLQVYPLVVPPPGTRILGPSPP